ncbi:glycosyltransferase [Marivirga sp.]|uniref:glycosyltransferase n=1 Tax=Marivirga sp. TaxID=2018662 RepID=UPI0025F82A56|nr:glycosyltransferase [Marivirga sp.]
MERKKILFVCPYPFDEAPSQRFRFEQYLSILKKEGFYYQLAPFLNLKAWNILYKSGNSFQKLLWLKLSFIKRLFLLFQLHPYEFIFIHREATPVGPPFFEWAVRFIWRKKILYDFDDAIWLEDPNEKGSLKARLKWKSKVKSICKWSYKVSCGNEYLTQFAKEFNKQVVLNPTTIDTDYHKELKVPNTNKITIGWTGTHSTLPYLKPLIPILDKLFIEFDFELLVISNQKPDFDVNYMRFIDWNKSSEIEDLNQINIGVMPLTDDIWSQGKCGFKLLQYMAIRKPVIASTVGVNEKIINESQAGFSAKTEKEWSKSIVKLLTNNELRKDLGNNGAAYIKDNYSVHSNKNTFLSLFE